METIELEKKAQGYQRCGNATRIVVAEDEPNLVNSLRFVLNAAGHSVSMVPNGREALTVIQNSIFANTPIDLLVTDIAMPEMSGEELIVALRSQSIQIPILVITGYGDKDLVIRLMRLGCQDFLDKPFDPVSLESRITAILLQHQERLSRCKREEYFAKIGERSRSIIHDLNNIIGGTLGYAEMAMNGFGKGHPAHKYLAKLLTTANKAADVCGRFLSLKPDAPIFMKTKTEVRPLVEKIAALLKAMAPDYIKIQTVGPEEPLWLNVDPDRVQQAILNLGINAIQAMGSMEGFVFLTVSAQEIPDSSGSARQCVCIMVSDTGKGIAEENFSRLFEEGFSTKVHGNGIGLPTVKRIMDEHGGRIIITRGAKKGMQFTLVFPIAAK